MRRKAGRSSRGSSFPSTKPPISHCAKPLSQPVTLRPCTRKHLGFFHILCLTQRLRDNAGGIFHRPFPACFPSSSASPFPVPSALCHPPSQQLARLPVSSQNHRNQGEVPAAPRPGPFPATCKGSLAPAHTDRNGTRSHGFQGHTIFKVLSDEYHLPPGSHSRRPSRCRR